MNSDYAHEQTLKAIKDATVYVEGIKETKADLLEKLIMFNDYIDQDVYSKCERIICTELKAMTLEIQNLIEGL